ncbi:phage holin family protein [Paenibacillus terrigena]|uniref:phage holin family protein n=1 Tax=Paenibacillus terrigena TaxID=369333 RepID=UPI0028D54D4B|nr:phage holin family protein [Paenibacillus terrigena]
MNQIALNTITGIVGSVVTFAFGGWSQLLTFFLVAITVDYITGVAASLREGQGLNSNTGFWGIARKVFMLFIIMLGHQMDLLLETEIIMSGAIYFYLANELISITENYGRLGLPLPQKIRDMIQILKQKDK